MQNIQYSDINFDFMRNPFSNDIGIKINDESIKQSIKNLLLTNYNERPFQTYIGSQVQDSLFELSVIGDGILKKAIANCINSFEPRITLNTIHITSNDDEHTVHIALDLNITNTTRIITMGITLEKTR